MYVSRKQIDACEITKCLGTSCGFYPFILVIVFPYQPSMKADLRKMLIADLIFYGVVA